MVVRLCAIGAELVDGRQLAKPKVLPCAAGKRRMKVKQ
jgi:hypothetical protein